MHAKVPEIILYTKRGDDSINACCHVARHADGAYWYTVAVLGGCGC